MNPSVDAFRILGLAPTASLEEATSSYKDLIRVWHPDRFTSDPRLRAKAEEQTRLLNQAIAHLRDVSRSDIARAEPQTVKRQPQPAPRSREQPQQCVRTLELRTVRAHIVRTTLMYAALFAVSALNVMRLESEYPITMEFALSALVAAYSLSHMLFNVALFFSNTPIISINMAEMRILGLPRIPITDIWEMWFFSRKQEIYLRIIVTDAYLKTVPRQTRLWLQLVKFYQGFHLQIPCSRLDIHPTHVLTVMDLVNAYGAAPLKSNPHKRLSVAIHANSLATLAVLMLVLRCIVEHEGYEVSYLPYLVIYLLARGYSVLESVVLAPRC